MALAVFRLLLRQLKYDSNISASLIQGHSSSSIFKFSFYGKSNMVSCTIHLIKFKEKENTISDFADSDRFSEKMGCLKSRITA